jgi:glucokinase
MSLLGIEIGGTKIQLVTGEASGRIVARRRLMVDKSRGGEGIREQIAAALPELLREFKPTAIGVGFGGPVDRASGRIAVSHQIEGWSGFDLAGWLRGLSGLPVAIENDANTAALGEACWGAGRGFDPVFYVTLGSGVGGGLVVGGKIYHGATPGEAEIGHVRLDKSGTIVEQRCSGWAVDEKIREATRREPWSLLGKLTADADRGQARALSPALSQNCPVSRRILDETAEDLAFALSHVTHLFHPQIIVLGGGLSLVGEPLRAAVAAQLPRFLMDVFGRGPEVKIAALGEDAVPVGTLLCAAS